MEPRLTQQYLPQVYPPILGELRLWAHTQTSLQKLRLTIFVSRHGILTSRPTCKKDFTI